MPVLKRRSRTKNACRNTFNPGIDISFEYIKKLKIKPAIKPTNKLKISSKNESNENEEVKAIHNLKHQLQSLTPSVKSQEINFYSVENLFIIKIS